MGRAMSAIEHISLSSANTLSTVPVAISATLELRDDPETAGGLWSRSGILQASDSPARFGQEGVGRVL